LALLALIAGQDVEWIDDPNAPGSRWWQIARRVAHDRVISTVDPDARHAHKTRNAAMTASKRMWSPNPTPESSPRCH